MVILQHLLDVRPPVSPMISTPQLVALCFAPLSLPADELVVGWELMLIVNNKPHFTRERKSWWRLCGSTGHAAIEMNRYKM